MSTTTTTPPTNTSNPLPSTSNSESSAWKETLNLPAKDARPQTEVSLILIEVECEDNIEY